MAVVGCKLLLCAIVHLLVGMASGNVVLMGRDFSKSFSDAEANFAPNIKGSGEIGALYLAVPLNACDPLTNEVPKGPGSSFVLIMRGECNFDVKVRRAQNAGFQAAIVYDNEDSGVLVAMSGSPTGIHIHAVFVSKASGGILRKYAGWTHEEVWLIPNFEDSTWSIMAISLTSLLAICALLATCFFLRRNRISRERPRASNIRDFHGMSSHLVKAMPSLIFTVVMEDNCTSRTCAICLEDYNIGDKLRILPCSHKFHASCIDLWLTDWRAFCPVCKRDARTSSVNPPASENTPLLSSTAPSPSPSPAALSSFQSSLPASPPIQIVISRPGTPSTSQIHSSPGSNMLSSHSSYRNSSDMLISGSSRDLRNSLSHASHASYLSSPCSLGCPLSSSVRHLSLHNLSPSNASLSYLAGSSGHQSYMRHCNGSGTNLSAFASVQSPPEC